jgi:hypothetical protein
MVRVEPGGTNSFLCLFLARPAGLAGNRHFTGFVESKIPCATAVPVPRNYQILGI